MKKEIHFSDEFLNAYLDDELNYSDKAGLLSAIRTDEILSRRLCQLQRVRNMVQLAYSDINVAPSQQSPTNEKTSVLPRFAAAASILLFTGILAGWFTHNYFNNQSGFTEIVQELRTNTPLNGTPWKLMVQVSSNNQHRFNVLMDETERLLQTAQSNNEQVIIQILANAEGINLLKDDQSPMSVRVRELDRKYSNLLLTACGQTLKKLQLNNKKIPRLLNAANIVPSALQEVIEKQRQGWTYIKI